MFIRSAIIQGASAIALFVYYYFLTLLFDLQSENIFFVCISITALSMLLCDFSFAITHVNSASSLQATLETSQGLRNLLIFSSLALSFLYWVMIFDSLNLNHWLIFLLLIFQFSEIVIPYYILIVMNCGMIGQILRLLKVTALLIGFSIINIDLEKILFLNISFNLLIYIFIVLWLIKLGNVSYISSFFNLKICNLEALKLYSKNFLPNLGGLIIGLVIPVFGVHTLGKDALNVVILSDRLVRNFENIFQAVLQWNLREIKELGKVKFIYSIKLFALANLIFILISPILISILLNTNFNKLEEFYLRIYCTIGFMGPIMTLVGVKYFVFYNRTVEFSLAVSAIGISAIMVIMSTTIPIQLALPIIYLLALVWLVVRRSNEGEKY